MATIAENLERIQQAKADIKSAIEAKGVTVPSSATIDTYDDYVAQISGGAATPSNLSDWTYDSFGKITSAVIRNGVTSLDYTNGFYSCTSLSSVTIPDSVTSIGVHAFYSCTSLSSVTIPDSVTTLGQAFQICLSLTSVTIGSGITSINGGAFANSDLRNITINATTPPSGGSADYGIFANTPIANGEGWIYVPEESVDAYKASSGFSAYSAVITCIGCGSASCSEKLCGINVDGDEFTIPDDGTDELSRNDNIQSYNPSEATVGDIITTIGVHAFRNCTSLSSVTIPDSVTTISYGAFQDCTSLTSVTIPDSVTSIGENVFNGCENLTSVTIGSGVTTIGGNAFDSCTSLTSVTIPDSVTSIGENVFQNCLSLTSVTIGSGVTSIGDYAFAYSDLNNITINATTPPSGGSANYGIFADTPIANGEGWIYVPEESVDAYKASSGFSAYSAVITCIGCGSASCSEKLCGINVDGDEFTILDDGTDELTQGDGIERYDPSEATVGDIITTIRNHAFMNCMGLTSVTIGSGVTSIGDYAFNSCTSLTSVIIYATNPPSLGIGAFDYTPIANGEGWIYVPDESVTDYQGLWNQYESQIRGISEL